MGVVMEVRQPHETGDDWLKRAKLCIGRSDGLVEFEERYGWCRCSHGWLCHAVWSDATYTDRVWTNCTAPGCDCTTFERTGATLSRSTDD